jgi:hypothetical protein
MLVETTPILRIRCISHMRYCEVPGMPVAQPVVAHSMQPVAAQSDATPRTAHVPMSSPLFARCSPKEHLTRRVRCAAVYPFPTNIRTHCVRLAAVQPVQHSHNFGNNPTQHPTLAVRGLP